MEKRISAGAIADARSPVPRIARYGDAAAEYHAIESGVALVDRGDRGLLEIDGADRASWLHNLTTHQVKTLAPGDGNYAFALNVKGRILFDMNILVGADSIRLDIDRRFLERAGAHFEKYVVIEDVHVTDRSHETVRFGLTGERVRKLCSEIGVPRAAALPALGADKLTWEGIAVPLFRHDFCGPFGLEFCVPVDRAVEFWRWLSESTWSVPITPVGSEAVHIRRIEAGIPWPMREITDEYLPAETGQSGRAVSFQKGCYLGQEVVERMRSRGVVARRLVGLAFEGDDGPPEGVSLADDDGVTVGTVTSVCRSMALDRCIGLGYVRSAVSAGGTPLNASGRDGTVRTTVCDLPFTPGPAD